MMDKGDFMDDGMQARAENFERLLKSGEPFFYDNDVLGQIVDYYLDYDQLEKAKKAIDYAERIFPFESYYKIKRAELFIARRQVQKAIHLLEKYRSIEPQNTEIAKLLGDSYALSLQFKRAIDCYVFALKYERKNDEILIRLARTNFAIGNAKKAISYINSFDPDYTHDELGIQEFIRMFMDYNQYDYAIQFLEKNIDKSPYSYISWYYTGLIYQRLEQHQKAINAYEYCIAIEDANTMGYLGKGNCLMELGQYKEAIDCFQQSLDGDETDAEVFCNIAECFENLDDRASAKKNYLRSIDLNPDLSDAYFGIAMVYKKDHHLPSAKRNLIKAISIDGHESMYHIELAEIYLIEENPDLCYEHYELAYEIDPETTEILLDYAHAKFELEDVEGAVQLLLSNLENHDEDHRVYYRVASYTFTLGHYEKGYNFLHAALQLNKDEYILLYEFAPFLENVENVSNIIDLYLK